jgi:hypothetical protein
VGRVGALGGSKGSDVLCACIAARAVIGGFILSSCLSWSLYAAVSVADVKVQLEGKLRVYRDCALLLGSIGVAWLGVEAVADAGIGVASVDSDGLVGSPRLSGLGVPGVGVIELPRVASLVGVIHARGSVEEYRLCLEDISKRREYSEYRRGDGKLAFGEQIRLVMILQGGRVVLLNGSLGGGKGSWGLGGLSHIYALNLTNDKYLTFLRQIGRIHLRTGNFACAPRFWAAVMSV